LTGMACGASALAALLLPQAIVGRSAARRAPGRIRDDVLAENRDITFFSEIANFLTSAMATSTVTE
jgi:hypothetical protein